MSYAEEMGFDGYDIPDFISNEENWKNGYHVDQNEKHHKLKDMTDKHLLATIKYFDHLDTTPLEEELKRRELLSTPQE